MIGAVLTLTMLYWMFGVIVVALVYDLDAKIRDIISDARWSWTTKFWTTSILVVWWPLLIILYVVLACQCVIDWVTDWVVDKVGGR